MRHEGPHLRMVLHARRRLDTAADIHAIRLDQADRVAHVVGSQAAGKNHRTVWCSLNRQGGLGLNRQRPIERRARAARPAFDIGIQQNRCHSIGWHARQVFTAAYPYPFQDRQAKLRTICWQFFTMKLRIRQPAPRHDVANDVRCLVHKHADRCHKGWQLCNDFSHGFRADNPWTLRVEDEPDRVGPCVHRRHRVLQRYVSTNFDPDHGENCTMHVLIVPT